MSFSQQAKFFEWPETQPCLPDNLIVTCATDVDGTVNLASTGVATTVEGSLDVDETTNLDGAVTANANVNPAPAGGYTYTVTVTDGNNCTDTDDVLVTAVNNPTVDAGADQFSCNGADVILTAKSMVARWRPW